MHEVMVTCQSSGRGRGGRMPGRNSASLLKAEVRAPQSDQNLPPPNALCSEYCFMWVERTLLQNGGQRPQKAQCPRRRNGLTGHWELGGAWALSWELEAPRGSQGCWPVSHTLRSKNIRETITWIISLYPHQHALNIYYPHFTGGEMGEAENN